METVLDEVYGDGLTINKHLHVQMLNSWRAEADELTYHRSLLGNDDCLLILTFDEDIDLKLRYSYLKLFSFRCLCEVAYEDKDCVRFIVEKNFISLIHQTIYDLKTNKLNPVGTLSMSLILDDKLN